MAAVTPRIACIVTEYRHLSHADVIVGRLLEGYEMFWVPVRPHVQVVSLYTDQVPANDMSRAVAAKHGVPIYPTIREALTLGGSELAVDGVVIVGEHGDYPINEKGQKQYPRRRLFEETVAVFRESGRVVPVFNDKHLAWNWDDAKWMYDTARELGIPFMAGSSLPLTDRQPPAQVELEAPVEEVVVVYHGGIEAYGFHALEMAQCLAERRAGFETGVAAVRTLRGDALVQALSGDAPWSAGLLAAALARGGHAEGTPQAAIERREAARREPAANGGRPAGEPVDPGAFVVEYRDGLRLTAFILPDYVRGAGAAVRIAGVDEPLAFRLGGHRLEHFSKLVWHVEELIRTGRPTYPVERTLLTTGVLDAAMTSRFEGGRRVETPHLDIRYRPPEPTWQPQASSGGYGRYR